MATTKKSFTAKRKLTETQLALLKIIGERPLTFKDIERTSRIPKPTFAAFVRTAKGLGLVQTGEIHGYYYAITQKGRKVVLLSERMEEALGNGSESHETG